MTTSWWNRFLKPKSRPAPRRRPARARLGVEQLETRLVPTVSVNLVNGQLQVLDGDRSAHTITLDHSGPANGFAETFVFVDGQRFFNGGSSLITAGVVINTGNDNATVNIFGAAQPTTITAGSGNDIVNLGKKGNVQAIQAPVSILSPGSGGGAALTVDDSNDPVSRDVTMGVSNGTGTITGLAPAAISYGAANITSVTVDGGSGGNGFTVADTVLNSRAGFLGTTLNSGDSDDTVNVLQTHGPLSVNTQGGILVDQVIVGNAHSLQGIHGQLTVSTSFLSTLVLDGSADKTGQHATVTGNSVLNLAPAPIFFEAAPQSFFSVEIDPGSGTNTFDVRQVLASTSLDFFRGSGNSTVNVGSPLNTLDTIQGEIHVNGGSGTITVNVNDQGSTTPNQYLAGFDGNEVERLNPGGTVVGAVTIDSLDPAGQIAINLQGGSGGNTFNVKDTLIDVTTTLNTGQGADTINVQGTTGPLVLNGQSGLDTVNVGQGGSVQGIKGALTVTNSGSFSALNVDDHLDPTGRVVTMDVANGIGTITGLAPATIKYTAGDVGSVSVSGGDGANTFNVANTVSNPEVPTTTIHTGTGVAGAKFDVVNVLGTTGALNIDAQGGSLPGDEINIGKAGNARGILGAVAVSTSNNNTLLVVDDSADTVSRTVTVTGTTITGLTPGTITYSAVPVIDLSGSAGGDTFNVQGMPPVLRVLGGAGNDTMNVGSLAHSLDGFGQLSFTGAGGTNALNVNDQGSTASETYTIKAGSVKRDAGPVSIFFGGLKNLTVNGDGSGNTFNVQDTGAGATTTLNTGIGSDLVDVQGTTGALAINGQSGADTVIVGSNTSVQAVKGDVTVTNNGNFTQLTVSDASDPNAHNVSMGVGADGFGFISGLAQGTVRYKSNDVSAVLVNGPQAGSTFTVTDTVNNSQSPHTIIFGGNGNDTFNVRKTTGALTVNAGSSNDVVNVGSTANTLDPIQGAVTVDGGTGGTDTLNVNDQGSTTPHTYTQTATTLDRSGAARITFANIEHLQVHKGPVAGSAPQAKNLTMTKSVKAGQSATLSGRLVDENAVAKLSLMADWGDGTKPQELEPGQSPFHLKHKYHKAGHYTVRVVWTDLKTGESNSRDLSLTVKP
jgi:acrosin